MDSAQTDDARAAAALGYVGGITTNPLLMVRAGAKRPLVRLREILESFPVGDIFYQPCATDLSEVEDEALAASALDRSRVGIKLLADEPYFQIANKLSVAGVNCAMTAVYSPAQALVASDAGCKWVIPYVDRSQRLMEDGGDVVFAIRELLDAKRSKTEILAASIKSVEQALQALLDGAHEVSASLEVLRAMAGHELTRSAQVEFEAAATDFERHD